MIAGTELGRVALGEYSVAYRHAGKGTCLVLLHGFLCDSRVWKRQLMDLSDQLTVIAWDAPGAGSSSDPLEPFTMHDWASCLAQFLDAVDVPRAHVLGLSWGGVLAQEFYRLNPTRILSLILADTYAGWKGSLTESACQQRLARCSLEASMPAAEFVKRWVPKEFFTDAGSQDLQREMSAVVADFHPLGFRLMAKSLADTDTNDLLPTIDVPTFLLWGDDDRRSPMNIATQLRDAIPGAELAVIANAGHVSNMEQPEQFSAQVRGFFSRLGSASRPSRSTEPDPRT